MRSTIGKLYCWEMEENESSFQFCEKNGMRDEEYKAYDTLMACLTEEQKEKFNKFIDLEGSNDCTDHEIAYRCGFKAGVKLALEVCNFRFEDVL